MEKDVAVPIILDVWQMTSEYAIIQQYDDTVCIRFKFWDKQQNEVYNKTALLKFEGVWSCRYSRFNKTRYYPKEIDHFYESYYLQIPNSTWLEEEKIKRLKYNPNWEKYDKRIYKHYVFQNNSYYIELIATTIKFEIVDRTLEDDSIWNT